MLRHTAFGVLACLGRKRRALVRCWETTSRQGVLPVFSGCAPSSGRCGTGLIGAAGSSARRRHRGGWSAGFDGRRRGRHAQVILRDQQLAVVVDCDPRRFGPVVAVNTGLDQAIEIPNGLGIEREGDQLGFERVCVAGHRDRSRLPKECQKFGIKIGLARPKKPRCGRRLQGVNAGGGGNGRPGRPPVSPHAAPISRGPRPNPADHRAADYREGGGGRPARRRGGEASRLARPDNPGNGRPQPCPQKTALIPVSSAKLSTGRQIIHGPSAPRPKPARNRRRPAQRGTAPRLRP